MGDFRDYDEGVQRIKYAILRSQYETGRVANSNQLALYYGIGVRIRQYTIGEMGGREPWPPLATSSKRSFPASEGSRSATSST